ncbi:MAG: hypothetical protein J6Z43_06025 [Clostridiales bacterium]|nr:hypothetical protein [Clostridiales bacterium]
MRKLCRHNKYGASTVFLSIVLSALILIECTYLTFVWDLDRRMEISRALKNEVEAIMADYDRELFDTYGIYAFCIDDVDDHVFAEVIGRHGLQTAQTVEIDGIETLDTESLRKAISSYYAYRAGSIAVRSMYFQVSGIIDEIDEKGVMNKIRSFTSSGASSYLVDILSDSTDIEERLAQFAEQIDTGMFEQYIPALEQIRELLNDSEDDVTSFDPELKLTNMPYLIEGYSLLESMIDNGSSFVSGRMDHTLLAHYAAYNFDCAVDNVEDCSIIGTRFADIHEDNYFDSEYMITGLDGRFGFVSVTTLMFYLIFAKNFISEYGDPSKTALYESAAILVSTLISALSGFTVDIPVELMKLILIVAVSIGESVKEVSDCLAGGSVTMVEEEGMELVRLKYRDFLFLYLYCVPDSFLLSRMLTVLERDYGQLCTGICLVTEYRGTSYDITKRYALYE